MISVQAQGFCEERLKLATAAGLGVHAKTLAPKPKVMSPVKVKTPKIAKEPYALSHAPTGSAQNAELQALKGNPPPRSSVSTLP